MNIVLAKSSDVAEAFNICIGMPPQRCSLDKTFLYIKTTQNTIDYIIKTNPKYTFEELLALTFTVEYTLEDVRTLLRTAAWQTVEEE